jgi:MoaA/NifB/PqqE/SkfB family radical SAM enzyme
MFRYGPSPEQLDRAEQMIVDHGIDMMLLHDLESEITYNYDAGDLKLNIAAGPDCPTRCEGCYNFFGDTAKPERDLVTAEQITDLVAAAKEDGVQQVTLYGGDPLHHPQIVEIVRNLDALKMHVKLDTVGTAFMSPVRAIYKGRGMRPLVPIEDIKPYVRFISIPLDGSKQTILQHFRKGRPELFEETLEVAEALRNAGMRFGINAVANAANIDDLVNIKDIAQEAGAEELQVFEFDYEGPNPSTRRDVLRLAPGRFATAASLLKEQENSEMGVVCKPFEGRAGSYFMIDDSGIAYTRTTGGGRQEIGHIAHDKDIVLQALHKHNEIKRGHHRIQLMDTLLERYLRARRISPRISQAMRAADASKAQSSRISS